MAMRTIQVTVEELESGEFLQKLEGAMSTAYHGLAMFGRTYPLAAEGSKAKLSATLEYSISSRDDNGLITIDITSDIKVSIPKAPKGITKTFAETNEDGTYEAHALVGAGDDQNPRQSRLCKRDGSPVDEE